MKRIALFASGSGTNVENIANYFKASNEIECSLVLVNKKDAFVIERAKKLNIPSRVFSRDEFYKSNKILDILNEYNIDLVVLAGFLWLVPNNLINKYADRIINIHPALLPKYGGKGMYGSKVHEAVVANNETESGITIHLVNEKYDDGAILSQAKCMVLASDNAYDVASKVHVLEYEYFPKVIEQYISDYFK